MHCGVKPFASSIAANHETRCRHQQSLTTRLPPSTPWRECDSLVGHQLSQLLWVLLLLAISLPAGLPRFASASLNRGRI
jgi:hypothetical protein